MRASLIIPILDKSLILRSLTQSRVYLLVIFFFIVSLILPQGPGIDTAELSATQSARTDDILSQRVFSIPFFSLPILFSIPLFFSFSARLKGGLGRIWGFEVLFLVFLVIAELSLLFTINIQASAVWFLKLFFGVAVYVIFSRLPLSKTQMRRIIYVFMALALLNIILAVLQVVKGGLLGIPFEIVRTLNRSEKILAFDKTDQIRAIGLLSAPNNLVSFLALLLPVSIALSLGKNVLVKIFSQVTIAGSLVVSVLAMSRWGFVTSLFGLLVTLFSLKFFKLHLPPVLTGAKVWAIVVLIFIIILSTNQLIFNRFTRFSPEDRSLNTRLELLSQSFYMLRENPLLGTGGGGFLVYFVNNDVTPSIISERFPARVHNFYLLLANELGIPALVVFLLVLLAFFKFVFLRIKRLGSQDKILAVGLFCAFVTFLFNGLWETLAFGTRVSMFAFLIAGILVNLLTRRELSR